MPQRRRNPRVVVLGAGPVGLAVAGSLRDRGFDVRVFEKRDHVPIAGGVVQLHVEGIYALKCVCCCCSSFLRNVHATVVSMGFKEGWLTFPKDAAR
jgi:2-polyprenyl-6-methoxyphenol hydroxylase-like FAD-dependent oxidoreductase